MVDTNDLKQVGHDSNGSQLIGERYVLLPKGYFFDAVLVPYVVHYKVGPYLTNPVDYLCVVKVDESVLDSRIARSS